MEYAEDYSMTGDSFKVNRESCQSADDWLHFMQTLDSKLSNETAHNRLQLLRNFYTEAFQKIQANAKETGTDLRANEAFGHLLVSYASLVSGLNEGRKWFGIAMKQTCLVAHVYLAAAQFEVKQGDKNRARTILMEAIGLDAKPSELILRALAGITENTECLDIGSGDCRKTNDSRPFRRPLTDLTGSSSLLCQHQHLHQNVAVKSISSSTVLVNGSALLENSAATTAADIQLNGNFDENKSDRSSTSTATATVIDIPSASSDVLSGGNCIEEEVKKRAVTPLELRYKSIGKARRVVADININQMTTGLNHSKQPTQDSRNLSSALQRRAQRVPVSSCRQEEESSDDERTREGQPIAAETVGISEGDNDGNEYLQLQCRDVIRTDAVISRSNTAITNAVSEPDIVQTTVTMASKLPSQQTVSSVVTLSTAVTVPTTTTSTTTITDQSSQTANISSAATQQSAVTGIPLLQFVNTKLSSAYSINTTTSPARTVNPELFATCSALSVVTATPAVNVGALLRSSISSTAVSAKSSGVHVYTGSVMSAGVPSLHLPNLEVPTANYVSAMSATTNSTGVVSTQLFSSEVQSGLLTTQQYVNLATQPSAFDAKSVTQLKNWKLINGKPYLMLGVIGRGGSGKVYDSVTADMKHYAVKCIEIDADNKEFLIGYLNEISIMRQLQNCNQIVKLIDHAVDEANDKLYVVMERGEADLTTLFRNISVQCPAALLSSIKTYWIQMLHAVQILHQHGIVHSDLKPANFILVGGVVKLIDFGIAKNIQADRTSVTCDQIVGTFNYMSPEAITDRNTGAGGQTKCDIKIGKKSDVWSLGCILYGLVYKHTPFETIHNPLNKLQAILDKNHPIVFLPVSLPHVVDVLKMCLDREPRNRPTVDELLLHPFVCNA